MKKKSGSGRTPVKGPDLDLETEYLRLCNQRARAVDRALSPGGDFSKIKKLSRTNGFRFVRSTLVKADERGQIRLKLDCIIPEIDNRHFYVTQGQAFVRGVNYVWIPQLLSCHSGVKTALLVQYAGAADVWMPATLEETMQHTGEMGHRIDVPTSVDIRTILDDSFDPRVNLVNDRDRCVWSWKMVADGLTPGFDYGTLFEVAYFDYSPP